MTRMTLPTLEPCGIYLHDPYANQTHMPESQRSSRLPESREGRGWSMQHRYSTETWLQEALRAHPWRVHRLQDADAVYVATDFARLCSAGPGGRGHPERPLLRLWSSVLHDRTLWPKHKWGMISREGLAELRQDRTPQGPPKVFSLQMQACMPYVNNNRTAYVPDDVLWLAEFEPHGSRARFAATPFVVSHPPWLAGEPGAATPPELVTPWAGRQLLFFVGHIPRNPRLRLGHAGTRFDICIQMHLGLGPQTSRLPLDRLPTRLSAVTGQGGRCTATRA